MAMARFCRLPRTGFSMPRHSFVLCLLLALCVPARAADPVVQWWADVTALAGDDMKGRLTGTDDYLRAADYVIGRLKAEGIKPAGVKGYLQPVALEQQVVDQVASRADLIAANGAVTPIKVGDDMLIGAGGGPRPASLDAPLVFIGYGLHLPKQGHDDFAGQDLKGKIVVVLSGGPADISGAIKSNARFERSEALAKLGALGVISLTTPKQVEILWERQKLLVRQPGMYLADAGLRDIKAPFFSATFDSSQSELLFKGSGHSFSELAGLADASKPLPHFALPLRLKARIVTTRGQLTSPNIAAVLEGSDPRLKSEYVALSAHLDHLGVGAAVKGDTIYNGAMDDATGVASVLDIARRLKSGRPLKRSILFLFFTAEEKGLLGSSYYARRPTVPKGSIVADMNFDMPLPLWPLKTVYSPGQEESSLGEDLRVSAAAMGIAMTTDPMPDRNAFIRADQYSFVREGIPALFFKFGFVRDTPEFEIEKSWRANRYHSPSDDLEQPILKDEAVKLNALVAAVTRRVADADTCPQWTPGSIFRKD
jgi:Zn-dependent M28 family amino/carboxypeptidase